MLRIVLFLLQHWSIYPAALQTSVAPQSPHHRATEGSGNRQSRNMGLPKRSHTAPSPLGQTSGAVWLLQPQTGYSCTHQMLPPHWPQPRLTLTLTPRHRGPPDSPRSKVNTAATHQTRFKSPCQCQMVNRQKISLLECVTEFQQRLSRKARNEIMVIWRQ